ncbi:MAG: bacterio-opsin activator domain-containing protein [Haloarculaceae archaeon]
MFLVDIVAVVVRDVGDERQEGRDDHVERTASSQRLVADGGSPRETGPVRERVRDRSADAIVSVDTEWRIEYASDRAERFVDCDADALLGESVSEVVPDLADTSFEAALRAAIERGVERTVEADYPPTEGRVRVSVYPDASGATIHFATVAEQTAAKRELQRNEAALRDLQTLAASGDLDVDEKVERALEIGCDRLALPVGFLTRIDADEQTIVHARGDHAQLQVGDSAPLSESYCRKTIESSGLLGVRDAPAEGWEDDPAYDRYELDCYLGSKVLVDGDLYGTFCFADTDPRERPFTDAEETFIELLTEWVSHELERRRRERHLERHEAVVESIDDGVYELDADGTIVFVNQAMCERTGYDEGELLGSHASLAMDAESTTRSREVIADAMKRGEDSVTYDLTLTPRGRQPVPCENNVRILRDDDGTFQGTVGVIRDVTDQREHRDRLSDLLAASRTLMQARTREEVADMVVGAARDVLGFEFAVVRLYDADAEELVSVARSEAVSTDLEDLPRYGLDEGPPGEVFATGESAVYQDVAAIDDDRNRSPISSAMYFPMGVHGTVAIATDRAEDIAAVDRQLGALLATSAAAACNRAKREQEVREAHERIDALVDRINGLIEETIEVLVQATTREEIESAVCDRLVATAPYDSAWVGRPDLASDTLEATASRDCAWDDGDAVVAVEDDSTDPTVRALQTGEPQVVEDFAERTVTGPHERARQAGMRGLVAIPLSYKDTCYGVLTVYAGEPDAFADREQVVLTALGRAIGNAINAVERGRIFTTDHVVELAFTARDDALLFSRLSDGADCRIESAGTMQQADGQLHLYLTSDDADPETLVAVAADDPDIRQARCVVTHEGESLFELVVEDALATTLADRGVLPRDVRGDHGETHVTVELPYESEAREVFELVADRYSGVDLVGYHEHERPVQTPQEFRAAVLDRFTDRQETAIRTAFLGGFFEWPRDVDGTELAEAMGVTRPTFHQHLRAAQRKVLEELFELDRETSTASRGVDS